MPPIGQMALRDAAHGITPWHDTRQKHQSDQTTPWHNTYRTARGTWQMAHNT